MAWHPEQGPGLRCQWGRYLLRHATACSRSTSQGCPDLARYEDPALHDSVHMGWRGRQTRAARATAHESFVIPRVMRSQGEGA